MPRREVCPAQRRRERLQRDPRGQDGEAQRSVGLLAVDRMKLGVVAEEASLRLWHMRLVEGFVAVTGKYVQEKMTVERFAETLLLTWEMVQKICVDRPGLERPRLGKKRGLVTIGTPIVVSDRFAEYSRDRRSGKQAVTLLTQDLQTALQEMIR